MTSCCGCGTELTKENKAGLLPSADFDYDGALGASVCKKCAPVAEEIAVAMIGGGSKAAHDAAMEHNYNYKLGFLSRLKSELFRKVRFA